jgi:hypothetical protein
MTKAEALVVQLYDEAIEDAIELCRGQNSVADCIIALRQFQAIRNEGRGAVIELVEKVIGEAA